MEGGRGREAFSKCVLYVFVLNVLMLGGTVEQLASAVPQRPAGGSGAHKVSCWQIQTNKGLISNAQYT